MASSSTPSSSSAGLSIERSDLHMNRFATVYSFGRSLTRTCRVPRAGVRVTLWTTWVTLLLGLAVLMDPTAVFLGLLRNESFFRARPTTYWSRVIWSTCSETSVGEESVWRHRLFSLLRIEHSEDVTPAILEGDPLSVPVLRELLQDEMPFVRYQAAIALARLPDIEAEELVPLLAEALLYPWDYWTRYDAASQLEVLGPAAQSAIPALIQALGDTGSFMGSNHDSVRRMASRTLVRLGAAARPALVEALHANDEGISRGARRTLQYIEKKTSMDYEAQTRKSGEVHK